MVNFHLNDSDDDNDNDYEGKVQYIDIDKRNSRIERESRAADRLSIRLLAVDDDDEADLILRQSLRLGAFQRTSDDDEDEDLLLVDDDEDEGNEKEMMSGDELFQRSKRLSQRSIEGKEARKKVAMMVFWAILGITVIIAAIIAVNKVVGPPNQPVGPYKLVERQEGDDFFQYYSFYEGPDSVGSNGYLQYVNQEHAIQRQILNVTYEIDDLDLYKQNNKNDNSDNNNISRKTIETEKKEPFIYMGSAPTKAGPRDSIRLEGIRRFNRGLFIIDIRHMPAGCGVWPAFWLTDEANWPVNGEIDIVEGVNYQSEAKTALHSTKGCSMEDIPLGTMTGSWDTAQGIPDAKTGIPDMTLRYARDCFVYNPHQWLNQGCVAVDTDGDSLGPPLNEKGGGVFALEWDPINRYIRSWVFTPHTEVPDNLVDAIRTANLKEDEQIMPDTSLWPVPYGYYAIGDGTDCPASHFRQMRLVFNTAFCGSVSGNRFHLDCPLQAKNFSTCNEWIKSNPTEMEEAYWKIRGVFVYQREWERTWLH